MARIGMKYIVCAPFTAKDMNYGAGKVIAKAIKADVEINYNDVPLYADDRKVDSMSEFQDGKITLEGDHFDFVTRELLLGHKRSDATGSGETLTYKTDDDGSFVGIGFYSTTRVNGVNKYLAIWHTKTKFREAGDSYGTKGAGGNFQTPELEGDILSNEDGVWKEEILVSTEKAAREWLNEKANIIDIAGD